MIDLRSDTVTRPTDEMRAAMAAAEVGDDVFGEDPTVNRLQEYAADVFEKEAALFVPTGSMGNQIAVKLHTRPGQEVVIEERGHIFNYEMGAPAAISGVMMRTVKSGDGSGHLSWDEIAAALHVNLPYYTAPTGLICLENTHNLAGGTVMTAEHCAEICEKAHALNLPVHMDGARIFNAATALGATVAELTRGCDSVQFCLSKGLGAPVGSMLLGTKTFIAEARAWRKRLGGGMRQAGVIAAAGLIALRDGPSSLSADHENAKRLAHEIAHIDGMEIDADRVATNIVICRVRDGELAAGLVSALARRDILAISFGRLVRFVTHRDVSAKQIDEAVGAVDEFMQSAAPLGQ